MKSFHLFSRSPSILLFSGPWNTFQINTLRVFWPRKSFLAGNWTSLFRGNAASLAEGACCRLSGVAAGSWLGFRGDNQTNKENAGDTSPFYEKYNNRFCLFSYHMASIKSELHHFKWNARKYEQIWPRPGASCHRCATSVGEWEAYQPQQRSFILPVFEPARADPNLFELKRALISHTIIRRFQSAGGSSHCLAVTKVSPTPLRNIAVLSGGLSDEDKWVNLKSNELPLNPHVLPENPPFISGCAELCTWLLFSVKVILFGHGGSDWFALQFLSLLNELFNMDLEATMEAEDWKGQPAAWASPLLQHCQQMQLVYFFKKRTDY